MKNLVKKLFLIAALCCCIGTAAFAARTSAAGTVKNAAVKKSGKYYIGYNKKTSKKIINKWGIVKVGKKTYKYYFGKKGRAYTGVRAIGSTPANTKLYYFGPKGRMIKTKTAKLQTLSKAGKKFTALKNYIASINKSNTCKSETACGMTMKVFKNGFTVYMDSGNKNLIGYILTD